MDLKQQFTTAAQLLVLLYLLYWSFTWNLPANFRGMHEKTTDQKMKRTSIKRGDLPLVLNKLTVLSETAKRIRRRTKIDSPITSLIPSFNKWKEAEIIKQERKSNQNQMLDTQRISKRKLNYASSKCGGKVLSSNKESKHRMAILNEKADEYMLNPCNAKQWFVIELCDTIEVTQIELANYELYSSSPKTFSVFWSEVYPTHSWHLLGSFEASDRRTLEAFEIKNRNLGKFIKILIFSHHGKEHYCTLSTVRILGYSMVHQFEDEEEENTSDFRKNNLGLHRTTDDDKIQNEVKQNKQRNFPATSQNVNRSLFSSSKKEPDSPLRPNFSNFIKPQRCRNNPLLFIKKSNNLMCALKIKNSVDPHIYSNKRNVLEDTKSCLNNNTRISNIYENKCSITEKIMKNSSNLNDTTNNSTDENLHSDKQADMKFSHKIVPNNTFIDTSKTEKSFSNLKLNENHAEDKYILSSDKDPSCSCYDKDKNEIKSQKTHKFQQDMVKYESSEDSAALIQKESVLIKLTSRIKSSEFNLSLINKYLEELSQSYRQQIEDMNTLFNETVTAINIASDKAIKIDKHQQKQIEGIEHKMRILNNKVDFLLMGQNNIIKQVIELHAFFLILEFIIISTIFTVFMNSFKRSCILLTKQNVQINENISNGISRKNSFMTSLPLSNKGK